MDRKRGNIVVSRRVCIRRRRAEPRKKWHQLRRRSSNGRYCKNITDYGAFIDLGEMDGLLHVTDISWKELTSI